MIAPQVSYVAKHSDGITYIFELAGRRAPFRMVASSMTTAGRDTDVRIPLRQIPLSVRRAARAALGVKG